jgi:hypothetical protein
LNQAVFKHGLTYRRMVTLISGLPGEGAFAAWIKDKSNRDMATYDPGHIGKSVQDTLNMNRRKAQIES